MGGSDATHARDDAVRTHPAVRDALHGGRPVVALETAVLTHGLPRESWVELAARFPALGEPPAWLDPHGALHRAAMDAMIRAVRDGGAVPAVTAVLDGVASVGLDEAELARLSGSTAVRKLAARDLAGAIARRESGGTTVSASLALCAAAGVRVFATGGIGGVHRGWTRRPDVSADLPALARHAVCVVSSGAKSILDLDATVEALESLSVPVVGWRCDRWPRFVAPSDRSARVDLTAAREHEVASICRAHWALGGGAVLVVQPVEASLAVEEDESADAEPAPTGAEATPALLARLAERTNGRSIVANLHLLRSNASTAASIAAALVAT